MRLLHEGGLPPGLLSDILSGQQLGRRWLQICGLMAGCAALYGSVCGMWNGTRLALYVAVKLPLALLLTSAFTVAFSWIVAAVAGLPLRFGQVAGLTFVALASGALLLASLTPVAALFTLTAPVPDAHHARTAHNLLYLMHTAFTGACGLAGTVSLWRAMRQLPSPRKTLRVVYVAWVLAYALVGSEVAWALRPFVGSIYEPIVFVRPNALEGNVFEFIFTDIVPHLLH